MKHLKLYEELSNYTRLVVGLENKIHIYFNTELKHVARECFRMFLTEIKNKGISVLVTEHANPFFVITSPGKSALDIWKMFPSDSKEWFNGKQISNLTWQDFRDPDQNTFMHFQIWDIRPSDLNHDHLDLFIINNSIQRTPNIVERPKL